MVAAIDRLMLVAPVKVLVVPGNHDRANALKLGVVLDAWYRNTDRVEVDAGPDLRKYEPYGVNLIGFTHGSEEKHADLPLTMAQEKPAEWARALHKEWHLGHFHKRKQQNFTAGDTHGGVPVRILPSLSGTDAWHYMKGYVKGQRAAEAYLWSFDNGYAGHFSSNVL
jgi:DNA repair exonuclease SbcCD nuclease subunit